MDLQDALNVLSATSSEGWRMPRLVVDGIFGHQTQLRVMEFQKARGILADGVVSIVVWEQIRLSLGKIPCLRVVRPLGGGGAGPCENLDKKQENPGGASSLGKTSEIASGSGNIGRGGSYWTSSNASSGAKVTGWISGLKGIDRQGLVYYSTSSSKGDGSGGNKSDNEEKKQQGDKKP